MPTTMLPTPSTSHVNFDRIYEPSEDSYIFLDTLSSPTESSFLRHHFPRESPSPVVLEVGTGSGVILGFVNAHVQYIFGRTDVATLGTDANVFACHAAVQTVKQAEKDNGDDRPGGFLDCQQVDLTTAFRERSVDVLISNPPYVPTEALPDITDERAMAELASKELFERDSHLLSYSYAGGVNGMEIADRLLSQLPGVLSDRGVAYILFCARNRPHEVQARICGWQPPGWRAKVVGTSGNKAGWERLQILRIWRHLSPAWEHDLHESTCA